MENNFKLVVFDVDGTLLTNYDFSWKLVWDYLGFDDSIRKSGFKKYLNGDFSYVFWANWCLDMWKTKKILNKSDFKEIFEEVRYANNLIMTLEKLKENNIKLAIISGGIDVIIEEKIIDYKKYFDYVYTNKLIFDEDDNLSGVIATNYDFEGKLSGVKDICKKENITLDEVVFVGDFINDVYVSKEVGLSIAYCSKTKELKDVCDVVIEKNDLSLILDSILK